MDTSQFKQKLNQQQPQPLSNELQQNLQAIKDMTGNSSDIIIRMLKSSIAEGIKIAIVYLSGLTDIHVINNDIISPLQSHIENKSKQKETALDSITMIKESILNIGSVKDIGSLEELTTALFVGNTVILMDGCIQGISASSSKVEQRGVEEPTSQSVIRGPKDGFTENININIALIRRRIKSPDLWRIDRKIGTLTQTDVTIMYLNGIANDKVVQEILQRLDGIDTDSILESGYIEEFVQDQTFTPFPLMSNSERPDSVAAGILEGQIAIFVDGTPFVLVAPVTFFKFFHSPEDYYHRYDIASFLRVMRFIAFIVSMLLPSLYIAITTFHQEIVPTTLLISLAAQREGIPFPAFIEALIMEITFEVLREAGVRMPRVIGPAISIVGALVLGQAAVQAGLVSPALVIVVSFTAISNFVTPAFNIAIAARMIRFFLMFFAATLGLFGILSGIFAMIIHMLSLRSFGIPYLSPVSPLIPANLKDIFIRVPWWMMSTRPRLFSPKNNVRQGKNQKPSPPSKENKK